MEFLNREINNILDKIGEKYDKNGFLDFFKN